MILSFLFYAFLLYLLFKLVVNFILPVYRTTKQVKKSFREMQQKMQEQQSAAYQQQQNQPSPKKQEPLGDYIDFEEVKD
ncbi:MAG TPA: hypothetical protein VGN63_23065 [Flavisolibacter sp.]|jgi:Sec-independent protein translocase protein TatA|nr:hypothetical protein [Flavisolibacter sp.]